MTTHYAAGDPTPNGLASPAWPHPARRGSGGFQAIIVAALALALHLLTGSPAAAQDAIGTPASTPIATPAPDAPRITVEFEELNDSGVSGEATLYEAGEQTMVEFALEDTGDNHPAHIHLGTCDDIQPEAAYNLENVTEDGASATLVDASLADLIDGDFVIDLHLTPNELGTLIVCAGIEGQPVNAAGTPVAVGGPGDPTAEPTAEPTATVAPTDEPAATEIAVAAVTEEPTATAVPTEEPTATPTQEPAPEPTATPEPAASLDTAADGTGGAERPIMSDGTGADSGKGMPLLTAPTPTLVPVGGISSTQGDGTNGGSQSLSGKGTAFDPTTSLPASTGSGSSLIFPESPARAAMWASGAFSIVLMMSAIAIRLGQQLRAHALHTGRRRRPGM